MTTTTAEAQPTAPNFRSRSSLLALIRGLGLLVLFAALTGTFLAQVLETPPASEASLEIAAPVVAGRL